MITAIIFFILGYASSHTQELALKISKQDKIIYCDVTEVDLQFTSKNITLKTSQGELTLTVIASKVGEAQLWITADEHGNRYVVDDIITEDKKGTGFIFVPEVDYLYTYTVANQPLCKLKR